MHNGQPSRVGVGSALARVEDGALLTGRANFSADVPLEGVLHASGHRPLTPT